MTEIVLPLYGSSIPVYPSFADFPITATEGQLAIALDTDTLYVFDGNLNTWSLVGPVPSPTAGDMISVVNNVISVDLAAVSGLRSTNPGAGKLQVQLEGTNPSLEIDGVNALGVAVDPAGAIVKNAGGIGIQLESVTPSLEIVSNGIGLKVDPALALVKGAGGVGINLEATNPTLKITTNQLGVKLNSGGALTAATGGIDVATNSVTNTLLAQLPANTIKGNNTGSTANAADLTVANVLSMLGIQSAWQTYTPTLVGFGSATNVKGTFKRIGDALSIQISFTAGIVTSTLASFSLPSALTLSTDTVNKITINNTTAQAGQVVGTYFASNVVSSQYNGWSGAVLTAPATSTTVVYAGLTTAGVGNPLIPAAANVVCDTGSLVSLKCEVILT